MPLILRSLLARRRRAGVVRSWRRARARDRRRARWRRPSADALTPSMLNYIIRRIGYGVLILIGVNLFTFFLFFTVNTPDDMARLNIGGKRVTQDAIEKWKVERGYDKPLYWNAAAQGAEKLTDTIFWRALGVAVRARLRPLGQRAATSATRSARACGSASRWRVPMFVLQVIVEHRVRAAAGVLPQLAHRLLGRRRCAC